jgi:hypothetical protein
VRLARAALLGLAGVLVVAACGGGKAASASSTSPTSTLSTSAAYVLKTYGNGANKVWAFLPRTGKPRSLVIFLHGLSDLAETTPAHHLPWIAHLAAKGSAVFYPAYEAKPGGANALDHVIAGVNLAVPSLGSARPPVVVIGYARGAGLAVDYSAVASVAGPVPKAVLGVFPQMFDPRLDMRTVSPGTRFLFLVGDRDTVAGTLGAQVLVSLLARARYPSRLVRVQTVASHGGFVASHAAPLGTSAAAQRAFWAPADALIAAARGGS